MNTYQLSPDFAWTCFVLYMVALVAFVLGLRKIAVKLDNYFTNKPKR